MLYRDEQLKNPVQPAPYETTSAGELLLEDLKPGTYYLEEVRAPAGYRLPANPVQLEVTWGTDGMKTRINGEETNRIYNSRNFTLPATGGGELLLLTASAAGMFFLFLAVGRQCGKNFRRRKRLES